MIAIGMACLACVILGKDFRIIIVLIEKVNYLEDISFNGALHHYIVLNSLFLQIEAILVSCDTAFADYFKNHP
jgi:hypothetical protein